MRTLIHSQTLMRVVRRWARKFVYFELEGATTDKLLLEDDSGYLMGEFN